MGVLAGIVPWIVIAITFIGSVVASGSDFPRFVIYIYVWIVVFFNLFTLNIALQYLGVSRWKNYLSGERVYIVSSPVAKSALAWQVYFGTLNSPIRVSRAQGSGGAPRATEVVAPMVAGHLCSSGRIHG